VEKYALKWYLCPAREENNPNDEVMPSNSIQTRFTLCQALPQATEVFRSINSSAVGLVDTAVDRLLEIGNFDRRHIQCQNGAPVT